MRKYKNQTLISVIGLAVGFTCFALASLWIRYEMTFDNFHKNAEHLYVVYVPSRTQTGYSRMSTPHRLAPHLKEAFSEVAHIVMLTPFLRLDATTMDGVEFPMLYATIDSSFLRMFDVKIITGSNDFMIPRSRKIAITEEKARKLFGNENPIGKTINMQNVVEKEICAVVSGMSKQSNYSFDFLEANIAD